MADLNATNKVTWEYDTEENRALVTENCGKASFPALQYEEGKVSIHLNTQHTQHTHTHTHTHAHTHTHTHTVCVHRVGCVCARFCWFLVSVFGPAPHPHVSPPLVLP